MKPLELPTINNITKADKLANEWLDADADEFPIDPHIRELALLMVAAITEMRAELSGVDMKVMMANRAGYTECLDDLGAPCPRSDMAPKERAELYLLYLEAK